MPIQQVVAIVVAVLACASDLRTRRIPNVLTFGAAALALPFAAVTGGWAGVGTALTGWLVGCALFFPMFALGGLGAGDVKLLAALGSWLGPMQVAMVGLNSALAGGVIGLAVAAQAGYLGSAFGNLRKLLLFWKAGGLRPLPELTLAHGTAPRLAYAVPVLTGLMVTLWLL